jgi:hypothetical protein
MSSTLSLAVSHAECQVIHWIIVLASKRTTDCRYCLQLKPLDQRSSYRERSRSRLALGSSLLQSSAESWWRPLCEESRNPLALVVFSYSLYQWYRWVRWILAFRMAFFYTLLASRAWPNVVRRLARRHVAGIGTWSKTALWQVPTKHSITKT